MLSKAPMNLKSWYFEKEQFLLHPVERREGSRLQTFLPALSSFRSLQRNNCRSQSPSKYQGWNLSISTDSLTNCSGAELHAKECERGRGMIARWFLVEEPGIPLFGGKKRVGIHEWVFTFYCITQSFVIWNIICIIFLVYCHTNSILLHSSPISGKCLQNTTRNWCKKWQAKTFSFHSFGSLYTLPCPLLRKKAVRKHPQLGHW